jgi:3-oxoacyl-[acyl-carrier-protein] synthase II
MEKAVRQAGIDANDIQYLNAHATSTPLGDRAELTAIKCVFGIDSGMAISSSKSATGHMLGASGALEAIYSVLSLRDQIAPPTLNLDEPDPAADGLRLVGSTAIKLPIEHVLSNSCGFGGVNASLVFRAV